MSDATRKLEEQMQKVYRFCEQNRISFVFSYQGMKESEDGQTAMAGTKSNMAGCLMGILDGALEKFSPVEIVQMLAKVDRGRSKND